MKQTTLPLTWISGAEELSSEESSSDNEFEEPVKPSPALYWTRVKSLVMIQNQQIMVYEANKDLKFDKGLSQVRRELGVAGGQFIFDPADFKDQAAGFRVKDYEISDEGLLEYGRVATKLRQQFQVKAETAKSGAEIE